MVFGFELNDDDYSDIWHAPEGHDYAVQFRRDQKDRWIWYSIAKSRKEGIAGFYDALELGSNPYLAVRLVTLSRYPPCSVFQVIKYQEASV